MLEKETARTIFLGFNELRDSISSLNQGLCGLSHELLYADGPFYDLCSENIRRNELLCAHGELNSYQRILKLAESLNLISESQTPFLLGMIQSNLQDLSIFDARIHSILAKPTHPKVIHIGNQHFDNGITLRDNSDFNEAVRKGQQMKGKDIIRIYNELGEACNSYFHKNLAAVEIAASCQVRFEEIIKDCRQGQK